MEYLIKRSKKKRNSLLRMRKGEKKIYIKKSTEEDNVDKDFKPNVFLEYLKRNCISFASPITKKSKEILSDNNKFNDNQSEDSNFLNKFNTIKNTKNINYINSENNIFSINTIRKEKFNNKDLYYKNIPLNDDIDSLNIEDFNNEKQKKNDNKKSEEEKTKISKLIEENEDQNQKSLEFYNLEIFYEGKGISIRVLKDEKFSNCLLIINKLLFPFHKISDFDILYKLKVLDTITLREEKLSNIIDSTSDSAIFYLREKTKKIVKKDKVTTVLIENFPSFTDLSTELNKFFEKEKRESDFNVDYKGNLCKVSFCECEKAFSLIVFLTKLKKNNPIFKRLKINMDYKLNVILDIKKLKTKQKPIKIYLPLINNKIKANKSISTEKKHLKLNTVKKNKYYNSNKNMNINNNNINDYNKINVNNINVVPNIRRTRRYDSCSVIIGNHFFDFQSNFIKNRLKNKDNSIGDYNKKMIDNLNNKKICNNKILHTNNNYNNNFDSCESEDSEEKNTILKSSNYIIDLKKFRNNKGLKK